MTGVSALAVGTVAKRLQLMHELVPAAAEIAFLRNPTNPNFSALETRELQGAAVVLGVRLRLLNASSLPEIEEAFANLVTQRVGAFLLGGRDHFLLDVQAGSETVLAMSACGRTHHYIPLCRRAGKCPSSVGSASWRFWRLY